VSNEIVAEIRLELDKFRSALKDAEAAGKASAEKAAQKYADAFENRAGGIASGLTAALGVVAAAAASVGVAFAAAVKGVHMAEEIEAAGRQFDILTAKAGISGEALSAGLAKASGGLIGTTELMQSANKALVDMGASAAQLPQLLDLARKATAIFGGDLQKNFEALNQSIVNTNTRGLKNLGIVIDQEKAYKDFAATVGVSASALSQAGRQQAILQAALAKGGTAFAGVDVNANKLSDTYTRMKVAVNDAIEAIAISFKKLAGSETGGVFSGITKAAENVSNVLISKYGNAVDASAARQKLLTDQVTHYESELERVSKSPWQNILFGGGATPAVLTTQLEAARLELSLLNEEQRKGNTLARERAATPPVEIAPVAAPPVIDPKILAEQQAAFAAEAVKHQEARIAAELTVAETNAEFVRLTNESKLAVEDTHQLALAELKRKYLDTNQITQAQYDGIAVNMEAEKNAKIKKLANEQNAFMTQITTLTKTAVVGGIASSFAALGGALAKAENGFSAFGKALLGTLGGLAIQIGSMIVSTAIGFGALGLVLPGFLASAAVAIPAGLALIVLGGALQAAGGAGGGGGAAGAASGGGGGGGVAAGGGTGQASAVDNGQNFQPNLRGEVGTGVTVNVQGNVLDRRQTGLELAEVINESIGNNGVTFAQAGA